MEARSLAGRVPAGRVLIDGTWIDGRTGANQVFCWGLNDAGQPAPRGADLLSGGLPCYATYRCADGKHMAVGALEGKFWKAIDVLADIAAQIRGSETNPVLVARKLYDWTLNNVEYWVKDPSKWKASPVGSSDYCFKNRTGNCTDFHSLWTALARASGIPTRMKYGSIFL